MARRPGATPGPIYLLCIPCRRAWVADRVTPCDVCGDADPLDCRPGTYDALTWYTLRTHSRADEIRAVRKAPWFESMAALGDRAARPAIGGRAIVLCLAGPVPGEVILGRRAA